MKKAIKYLSMFLAILFCIQAVPAIAIKALAVDIEEAIEQISADNITTKSEPEI